MARTPASSSKPATKKRKVKPVSAKGNCTERHSQLHQELQENIRKHGKSQRTNHLYQGQVDRARAWVKEYAANQAEIEARYQAESGEIEDDNERQAAQLDPEFGTCLMGNPVECTPIAVSLYLHHRCFREGNGKSTAEQIHAALLRHYNLLAGNKYHESQRFHKNDITGEWVGNPLRSSEVETTLQACKNKDGEAQRNHSRPMSMPDQDQIYYYSRSVCPPDFPTSDIKSLALKMKHLYYRAFSSSGITIWMRNAETANLQIKDLDFEPPSEPSGIRSEDYFVLHLLDRKGWQKKMKKNEHQRKGHRYKIYPQPDLPGADMHNHLRAWLDHYTSILMRPLEPDDYIFPSFNATWTSLQPNEPVDSKAIHSLINEFASAAGVKGAGTFTTHCFRRGGAQYRFMYAPVGKRWTLARIRWWGGWAEGEHKDTLLKYLLDELHTYEEDHSDALRPVDRCGSKSHAGEAAELAPLSASEGRLLFTKTLSELTRFIESSLKVGHHAPQTLVNPSPFHSYTPQPYPFVQPNPHASYNSSFWQPGNFPPLCPSYNPPPSQPGQSAPTLPHSPLLSQLGNVGPPGASTYFQIASSSLQTTSLPLSAPGIPVIPPVSRKQGADGFLQVVRDWEHADPRRGLTRALRDWPKEWLQEVGRQALYGQREMIATEFIEEYQRDEDAFRKAYPQHRNGISALLIAIRKKQQGKGVRRIRRSKS
ncbi:hypothetical protein VKT23_012575 [Stygiomarasmius scandens]|uniref:Uncharacterized protein n=1 Tax=Marasmiellus scandens TaxID=2682957 RepID=A0ABR1JA68_9AGAR